MSKSIVEQIIEWNEKKLGVKYPKSIKNIASMWCHATEEKKDLTTVKIPLLRKITKPTSGIINGVEFNFEETKS